MEHVKNFDQSMAAINW